MIIGDNAGKLKILSYLWQNAEVMPVGDELGILRARRVTRIAGERPSTARWRAELFLESVPACRAARVLTINA